MPCFLLFLPQDSRSVITFLGYKIASCSEYVNLFLLKGENQMYSFSINAIRHIHFVVFEPQVSMILIGLPLSVRRDRAGNRRAATREGSHTKSGRAKVQEQTQARPLVRGFVRCVAVWRGRYNVRKLLAICWLACGQAIIPSCRHSAGEENLGATTPGRAAWASPVSPYCRAVARFSASTSLQPTFSPSLVCVMMADV